MDTEFMVQDAFALIRPQWKPVNNLEEAGQIFAAAVKQNYQTPVAEKPTEADELEPDLSSDDGGDEEDLRIPDADEERSSGDEAEVSHHQGSDSIFTSETARQATADEEPQDIGSESEEEHIVVTRPDDEKDPEADAEFDRELAKMMAESLDSRKFERKPMFDVPLPMRRAQRDGSTPAEDSGGEAPAAVERPNMMKFSLLSKRGNRQQVRTVDLQLHCKHTDNCCRPARSTFRPTPVSQSPCARNSRPRELSSNASKTSF